MLRASMPGTSRRRHRSGPMRGVAPGLGIIAFCLCEPAMANPGTARRLAGVEAQGPASRSVTGLHHNPATLAKMPGFQFSSTVGAGLDHLSVRRFDIDARGVPGDGQGDTVHLLNPTGGYFIGASFFLDPVAIGAGVYDLSSRYRPLSNDAVRYHLAPDSDRGCALDPNRTCPNLRSGGSVETRTDFTLAVAYDFLDKVQFGVSLHFPRLRAHVSHDNDTSLVEASEKVGCSDDENARVEDPRCAERLSFRGRAKLRWFGLNPTPSTRFDFAATFGIAFDLGDRVTLGGRFRTMPVLSRGQITLNGEAVVCLPAEAAEAESSDLPACTNASAVEATVTESLGREAAIGGAFVLGRERAWKLDTNLYWIDACPGGVKPGECGSRDARRLSLVGLDRDASVLPESLIYRGHQDIYGVELWTRYQPWRLPKVASRRAQANRVRSRIDLLLGGGFTSPGVRPSALTAAESSGWTINASAGTSFEILRKTGSFFLVPGYGVDFLVPTRVGPSGHPPAFDPTAGPAFESSGGDINDPAAAAVLEGRARPTNAATYAGAVHTFLLSFRWAERGTGQL
jgi:hypothetical protein